MRKFIMIFLFVIILFGVSIVAQRYIFPLKYLEEVKEKAKKYDIEVEVVLAMIKAESNFRPKVVSYKGAVGLMQVLPSTAEWITTKRYGKKIYFDLYEVEDNIEIGCLYYSYLSKKYNGDKEKIFAAYNAGSSRIKDEKWKEIEETRTYVKRVKRYKKIYKFILKAYSKE